PGVPNVNDGGRPVSACPNSLHCQPAPAVAAELGQYYRALERLGCKGRLSHGDVPNRDLAFLPPGWQSPASRTEGHHALAIGTERSRSYGAIVLPRRRHRRPLPRVPDTCLPGVFPGGNYQGVAVWMERYLVNGHLIRDRYEGHF